MIITSFPHVNGYDIVDKVGVGSFSIVYKAYTKTVPKEIVAIKSLDIRYQKKNFADNIVKEISLLKFLKHENIVKLIDFTWDSKFIFIITEFCDEGDLSQFIRKKHKLAESLVRTLMQQLSLALQFLHGHGVCHMDLKPQNLLLLSKPTLKLKVADFGLSQILVPDNIEQSRFVGSLLYMAPEKLLYQQFDARVDLWSVGIIMYECLVGRPPYLSLTTKNIIDLTSKRTPIELPLNVNVSPNCKDLLKSLLKYDPNERITFERFFQHDFIDITHLPTPENYVKSIKLVEEALALDQNKKYSESIPKYKEVIQYLEAFINIETDLNKKAILNIRRNEYTSRIQTLENIINNKAGSSATQQTNLQPLPQLSGAQYELLRDLASVTPNIATGLDIGNTGDLYFADGKKQLALEKYTSALSMLIPLLGTEPTGPRKEMLHVQIQKWLILAEKLKHQLQSNA